MLKDFFTSEKTSPVDSEIDTVLGEMKRVGVTDNSYPELMRHLERLTDVKAKYRRPPINRDTIVIVVGGLVQILAIVAYEQRHVFNSKGLSHIIRPKGMY